VTASRERWLLLALAVLPLAPFASAAFGIDDPVFLAVARRIGAAPLDPFGFEMAWDATALEVARFNLNPPLFSYWLAPWLALFGESETWMHVAAWPFAALAAFAFHGIARRVGVAPALPATALLVSTPAFVVLATTLQLDVPVSAWLLCAVYALLCARDGGGRRAEWGAGLAAAAAGLTKYVGLASLPLLAAGMLLLPPRERRWSAGSWLRVVGVPALAFGAWGAFSLARYGFVHYAAGVALVGERRLALAELVNHWLSVPIWYGAALVFPLGFCARALWRGQRGAAWTLLCVAAGAAVAAFVLPTGEPRRRVPLELEQASLAAAGFGAALGCAALVLARGRELLREPVDRFLALWAGGFALFSIAVNWHVNAADALLIAPPWLLLLLRGPETRPSPRAQWALAAAALALSLALAAADAAQRNVYRRAAEEIAAAIGAEPGARWQVGQWGFQHYLERRGFRPLIPRSARTQGSPLQPGDWVASARNVSQLDVAAYMAGFRLRPVTSFAYPSRNPLRTTNPDAGAGFYSHHGGYVPFAWSREPLDEIGLARVVAVVAGPAP
jgi:4-amino-4-deoxy-L-arabinose transferase-like glycosyltransferase